MMDEDDYEESCPKEEKGLERSMRVEASVYQA